MKGCSCGWMTLPKPSLLPLCLYFLTAFPPRQKNVVEREGTAGSSGGVWRVGGVIFSPLPSTPPHSPLPSPILQCMWNQSQTHGHWSPRPRKSATPGRKSLLRLIALLCVGAHGWRGFTWPGAIVTSGPHALQTNGLLDKLLGEHRESSELFVLLLRRSHTHNAALIIGFRRPKSADSKRAPPQACISITCACVTIFLLFAYQDKMQSYKVQFF